jgi:hypothetical protein
LTLLLKSRRSSLQRILKFLSLRSLGLGCLMTWNRFRFLPRLRRLGTVASIHAGMSAHLCLRTAVDSRFSPIERLPLVHHYCALHQQGISDGHHPRLKGNRSSVRTIVKSSARCPCGRVGPTPKLNHLAHFGWAELLVWPATVLFVRLGCRHFFLRRIQMSPTGATAAVIGPSKSNGLSHSP